MPQSWVVCNLADVCYFESGYAFSSDDYSQCGTPLVRISNIIDSRVSLESCVYINSECDKRFHVKKGDLLIAMSGATTGKKGVYDSDETAFLNQRVGNIKVIDGDVLLNDYRNIFMYSQIDKILGLAYGGAQPNISANVICSLAIPIPSIEEQKRIVIAVDQCFSLIDTLETAKEDLQTTIAQAKSKILDLAIHGKLVPQDPNDEPAIELLKRINPKFTPCDNAHDTNHLPESWCWATLGALFQHNTGKALNKSDSHEGTIQPYLTTSNVYWNSFDFTEVKQMYFKDSEMEKCTVSKGDLLVCEGGDIGRAAIWNYDYNICIQNHIHRLRAKQEVDQTLYLYVLMLYKWKDWIQGKGIGLQGLSSGLLDKLVVPLPPYKEQKRIISKIEELFAVLDEIQKSIEV